MKFIDFLKVKWVFWGLEAPAFTWAVAFGLIIATFLVLLWFSGKVSWQKRIYDQTRKKIEKLKQKNPSVNKGLEGIVYEELREIFENNSSLANAWYQLDAQIVAITDSDKTVYWSPESAEIAFSDALVIDTKINRSFYNSVPGILTGIGLLTTFLAILVALLDVKLVNTQVQGLELLIQGLSGKFISSIAALLAATTYTLIEKPILYRLVKSRKSLVHTIDKILPRLTTTKIMVDIRTEMIEQTLAIKGFNTQLAPILKKSFSESMGPVIERMADTIDDLNKVLQINESQKQESITGTLESLLNNLERSMSQALEKMSNTFSESLSGTAKNQFDNVATSLKDTAILLDGMNSQFSNVQQSLNGLINFAKSSTEAQISLGNNQVENLTKVLENLMDRMNKNTDESLYKMNTFVVSTVADLSEQITGLNKQMMVNIENSSKRTDVIATNIIQQANNWSAQSADQLRKLLEKHEQVLIKTEGAKQALDISLRTFKEGVTQCASIYTNLNNFSVHMNTIMDNIESSSRNIKSSEEALKAISSSANSQIKTLYDINSQQGAIWVQIKHTMEAYQNTFKNVENAAKELLGEIAGHLENYTKASSQNFNNLVKVSDEHFANATKNLGAAVNELEGYLQDLTEVLEKQKQAGNIRR